MFSPTVSYQRWAPIHESIGFKLQVFKKSLKLPKSDMAMSVFDVLRSVSTNKTKLKIYLIQNEVTIPFKALYQY